jgi:hypothetical protein
LSAAQTSTARSDYADEMGRSVNSVGEPVSSGLSLSKSAGGAKDAFASITGNSCQSL